MIAIRSGSVDALHEYVNLKGVTYHQAHGGPGYQGFIDNIKINTIRYLQEEIDAIEDQFAGRSSSLKYRIREEGEAAKTTIEQKRRDWRNSRKASVPPLRNKVWL